MMRRTKQSSKWETKASVTANISKTVQERQFEPFVVNLTITQECSSNADVTNLLNNLESMVDNKIDDRLNK